MREVEFLKACETGDIKTVIELCDEVDINCRDQGWWTGLMIASQNEHVDIVTILIKSGAQVNLQNQKGYSALMIASSKKHTIIMENLIKSGSELNIQDKGGKTALMWASFHNRINSARVLIESGANFDIKNNHGDTAYDIAVQGNCVPVQYLFTRSIINQADNKGNTLLMRMCYEQHTANVLFLYEKGADFFLKNKQGRSAYDILVKSNIMPKKLQVLREKLMLEKEICCFNENINGFGL